MIMDEFSVSFKNIKEDMMSATEANLLYWSYRYWTAQEYRDKVNLPKTKVMGFPAKF